LILVVAVQVLAMFMPGLRDLLGLAELGTVQWGVLAGSLVMAGGVVAILMREGSG
jgi:hypothetical protein